MVLFPLPYLLKGEQAMKNNDTSSEDGVLSTSFPEREIDSDGQTLSSPHNMPQNAPFSASPTKMERRSKSHHRMQFLLVAMVGVVLVALAAGYGIFHAASQPSHQISSAFQQAHCPFVLGAGLVEGKDVICGFLSVPEDRSLPKSPKLHLAVAIFKTPNPQPSPDPVLFLSGGPGNALLVNQGPGYNLGNLPPNRDLILLDQRGTGYSQPSLMCLDNETLQDCHIRLVQSGINLNAFTTLEDAADVHDLIRALGYSQVNLEGVSYGTRLALTVMRLYPEDLRSVVLNSTYPPQANLFTNTPQAAERAFTILFHGCEADHFCNSAYPRLQAVFYQDIAELNTTPTTFQATTLSGIPVTVHFTGNNLVLLLRQTLYFTALIPELPRLIYQIHLHDYNLLASIYGNLVPTTESYGLFYAIECGEDMAYTTQQDLMASVRGLPPQIQPALLNAAMNNFSICQFWKVQTVSASQKVSVKSSIPTLILQGEYDPVTPPTNGMLTAQTLSKSYFFLFPGVGHGVSSPTNCPNSIMNSFLNNPTVKPDSSCISIMTEPFFT
jgi:pimeloyl-ACP methyl ester carboxylesterase